MKIIYNHLFTNKIVLVILIVALIFLGASCGSVRSEVKISEQHPQNIPEPPTIVIAQNPENFIDNNEVLNTQTSLSVNNTDKTEVNNTNYSNQVQNTVPEISGILDTSFGSEGISIIELSSIFKNEDIYDVIQQPDEKIIVIGSENPGFFAARINPDGNIDTGFGDHGKFVTSFLGGNDEAKIIDLQKDGKIVIGGFTNSDLFTTYGSIALTRLNANGSLDTSFNGNGKVIADVVDSRGVNRDYAFINAIKVLDDGKVLIGGSDDITSYNFLLLLYNPNGSLDKSFGSDGIVLTEFPGGKTSVNDIALQSDGKIVAIGSTCQLSGAYNCDLAIARYLPNGQLDIDFGDNGKVITPYDYWSPSLNKVVIQPDGKILATIDIRTFYRYTINGNIDSHFGNNGFLSQLHDYNQGLVGINSICVQENEKILVSVISYIDENTSYIDVLRFTSSGILDRGFGNEGTVRISFPGFLNSYFKFYKGSAGSISLVGTRFLSTNTGNYYLLAIARLK
jgi:uncharacterized delta-60 repeat protein